MGKERESSFELLRLLCIGGIIFMHTFGGINDSLLGINREISIFINALFNTGVTCFILISGYFGIQFDLKKLIRLDLVVIFYTLLGTILTGNLTAKALILSCIPIISRRYWFLSCYFALCALSVFLNKLTDKTDKKTLGGLILLLLFLFSVIPTFAFYELIPDSGKGIVQMVTVYLIGRYIRKYHTETLQKGRLFFVLAASTLTIFLLDSVLSLLKGTMMGTFCRDCSLFIIISSIALLLLFREFHFKCRLTNHLAGNVMPLYVMESFVRTSILNRFFDLSAYTDSPLLIVIVTGYVLAVIILCITINELRRLTLSHLDNFIADFLSKLVHKAMPYVIRLKAVLSTRFYAFLKTEI